MHRSGVVSKCVYWPWPWPRSRSIASDRHRSLPSPATGPRLRSDRGGKIPFAFAVLVLIMLLLGNLVFVTSIETKRSDQVVDRSVEEAAVVIEDTTRAIETYAYHATLAAIKNVTGVAAPDLMRIDPETRAAFSAYLGREFPRRIGDHDVAIIGWSLHVVPELRNTTTVYDRIHTVPRDEEPFPSSASHGLATDCNGAVVNSQLAVYFRTVGRVELEVTDVQYGRTLTREVNFDKNVYSTIPLLFGSFERLARESSGGFGELQRVVRYILETVAQFRVLNGYAAGHYGRDVTGEGQELLQILTADEVELAVNLALLLETARNYRAIDPYTLDAFPSSGGDGDETMREVLLAYLWNGTIDPADLYLLFLDLDEQQINVGRALGRCVYSFADQFVFDLLRVFWGDDYVDPVLAEPIVKYDELYGMGEAESRSLLYQYFATFRDWLGLPTTLREHHAQATINDIVEFGEGVDCVSAACEPPLPVMGDYELFSTTMPANWHINPVPGDNPLVPYGDTVDVIDLLLGEPANDNYLPKPYEVHYWTDFGDFNQLTIKYYMVYSSFIQKHAPGSDTPYYDSLVDVLETLNLSMRRQKLSVYDTEPNGLVEQIALDAGRTGTNAGLPTTPQTLDDLAPVDPHDTDTVVDSMLAVVLGDDNLPQSANPYSDALDGFTDLAAYQQRRNWWSQNAYVQDSELFLFQLFRETIDLFYEVYDTLDASCSADFGDYQPDYNPQAHIEAEQAKTNGVDDSYEFRTDALKHAYNSVMDIVLLRLIPSPTNEQYFSPSAGSMGEFMYAVPPIPETAWINYGRHSAVWDAVRTDISDACRSALGPVGGLASSGVRLEIAPGLASLQTKTDSRRYELLFFEFIFTNVGMPILTDPASPLEQLAKGEGWADQLICGETAEHLRGLADLNGLELLPEIRYNSSYWFWEGAAELADRPDRAMSEFCILNQVPDYVSRSPDQYGHSLSIYLSEPVRGVHLVDTQDPNSDLATSPFVTSWSVRITGEFALYTRTTRYGLLGAGAGHHGFSWYNASIRLELEFPVTVYSGWDLDGVEYLMTRDHLGVVNSEAEDTRLRPLFVSDQLDTFMDAARVSADWVLDTDLNVYHELIAAPSTLFDWKLLRTDSLASAFTFLDGAVAGAAEAGYIQAIGEAAAALRDASQGYGDAYADVDWSAQRFDWYGFDAVLDPSTPAVAFESAFSNYSLTYGGVMKVVSDLATPTMEWDLIVDPTSAMRFRYDGGWHPARGDGGGGSSAAEWGTFRFEARGTVPSAQSYTLADGASPLRDIPIPWFDTEYDLDLGVEVTGGTVPSAARDAVRELSSVPRPTELEDVVAGLKQYWGALYSGACDSLAGDDSVAVRFAVQEVAAVAGDDWVWALTHDTPDASALARWLEWLVNGARAVGYELGNEQLPSSLLATLPEDLVPQLGVRLEASDVSGTGGGVDLRAGSRFAADLAAYGVPMIGCGAVLGDDTSRTVTMGTFEGATWTYHGEIEY